MSEKKLFVLEGYREGTGKIPFGREATEQDLRALGWVKAPLAGAPSVEDKIKSAIEYEVGYLGNMHERLSMNPKKDAMLIVSIRAHEHFLAKLDELMEGSGKPKGDLHE